jgi:glycosyltransferase involved in cell wall biosynthesis
MALQRNAKTALAALSAHLAFDKLDRLICVSDRIRDELPAGVRKRALVIRNGVEDRQGGCTAAPGEVPTLCYVGSISESKGLMRLLEAAQILKRRLGRFRLLMAGTGPWEEEAHHYVQQQRLEGTVQMLGFVENAHEVYGQSHVFVLPSLYEGLPLTLLEASAAGCALVGHNVPGVADVIRDGDNGLFAPVSAEGLADTLEALICDRGYRESLCRGARRAYEDQWRAERMLSETMAVYDILTDEAPHGRRSALRRRR